MTLFLVSKSEVSLSSLGGFNITPFKLPQTLVLIIHVVGFYVKCESTLPRLYGALYDCETEDYKYKTLLGDDHGQSPVVPVNASCSLQISVQANGTKIQQYGEISGQKVALLVEITTCSHEA
jgi:hypothetical protein